MASIDVLFAGSYVHLGASALCVLSAVRQCIRFCTTYTYILVSSVPLVTLMLGPRISFRSLSTVTSHVLFKCSLYSVSYTSPYDILFRVRCSASKAVWGDRDSIVSDGGIQLGWATLPIVSQQPRVVARSGPQALTLTITHRIK